MDGRILLALIITVLFLIPFALVKKIKTVLGVHQVFDLE